MTEPVIGAAIDVGSNSVHLLVARIDASRLGRLEVLRDESVLLGLGDVVDREGEIPDDACPALIDALVRFRDVALTDGARSVTLLGTEPFRRARNAPAVVAEIHAASRLPLHVLSVRQEGELTYLGVTGGVPPDESLLVVDVGGGSTEVVIYTPQGGLFVTSLPSGSARLSVDIVDHDPPTPSEFDRLRLGALTLTIDLAAAGPQRAVFVGGTATNLARLAPLSREGLEQAHGLLTSLPAEEVVARFGVRLRRAQQLPAGTAIIEALFARYGVEAAEICQASLRDGAIWAAYTLGDDWLDRLSELVAR